ncbi:EAL domain-containing protein [Novosphingobium aquiterrae]|uniref:EAL domain-containing protein n=1 Tax=Novosphingobium aquiterrae TaxID=624388 RepID=A0ABV6PEU0_9SPHN
MKRLAFLDRDWGDARLFGPIVALTFGALLLLVITSGYLIHRFDTSASQREHHVVQNGFARQTRELNAVVATQVDWDDAILKLDHKLDAKWADFNIGNYLHTFNGFSHVFVVDPDAKPIYAAVVGQRSELESYAPFAATGMQLLPHIRAAERARPPIKVRPGKDNIQIPPIQANSVANVDGTIYLVTATLVQPDFGRVLPKGPRAPVTITAIPISTSMLGGFAERYLLNDAHVWDATGRSDGPGSLILRDYDGKPVAALTWTPQQPGTMVLRQIAVPLIVALVLLWYAATSILKRGSSVVSELVASEKRAKHLAYHDTLTGLPNRAMLFERLRPELAKLGEGGKPLAVMCVDLDRFKEVNDSLGHHAGDLVIEEVGRRLRNVCTEVGLIARLGGDEFVVLGECLKPACASNLADSVIAAICKPIECEYGRLEVGCSIGIVMLDQAGLDPSEVLRWADLALYRSKELGRQRVTFFEPEMDAALRNRRSLEADLRDALLNDGLEMVYQPQVDRLGNIVAVEALVRWHHPLRGSIAPGMFVPLAEEGGLILALGEFVLRRVFAETGHWTHTRVAINVSAVQMRAPGFAALVTRLAAAAAINPSRYEIEVTETALLGDDAITASNVEALKRLGFSIALDDFGTGYSSLSVLQRFAVDKIKIDRSFVSNLGVGDESEALVDAMVKLARALNLDVIAEGVETEQQRDRLLGCGCREFQGHLTGMPMGLRELVGLVGEDMGEEIAQPAQMPSEIRRLA